MNQKQYHSLEELPLMMNMTDVAAALGISRAGAYKLAHNADFPAFQIGRRIVVSHEKCAWQDAGRSQRQAAYCHRGQQEARSGEGWKLYARTVAEALVLRLRRTTGTVLNTGVLPQRHRSSHHSKAWQREAGKADDAANSAVLQ